ncbi:MAG: sialate O-acetylesterase [Verrucomicrobiota bacterium]|nr:sialate O-acetylesterase [Verrucomicrobiota bacterium]MDP6752507.1 sialate O-acetylesterase [Verrucomicrobiota bacterium]
MRSLLLFALGMAWVVSPIAADKKPVKVFLLAGQSNMEGKGRIDPLLNHQIRAPETKAFFAHFHNDGKYIERDDVWINYLKRRGKLTVGYGSPGRIGLELEFGHVMGNHFEEPVLLIKTAWGGKSIGRDFRPPSSGLQSKEKIDEFVENMCRRDYNNLIRREWDEAKKKNPKITRKEIEAKSDTSIDGIRLAKGDEYRKEVIESYGHYYRLMMSEIKTTLAELKTRFPDYDGRGYEIAGFVWFQGWNDMYNGFQDEYAVNMKNFIRDVRNDLAKPDLPFVIGIMGQNGFKPAKGNMAIVKAAQASMNDVPEFAGNVRAIPTDVHWDKRADAAFPTWRDNVAEWEKIGSDRPYHYLGSTITFTRIGRALGQALLELRGAK